MDTVSRLKENLDKLNAVRKSALSFLEGITDSKSFVETGTFTSGTTFEDGVKAEGEGIITGYATISGIPVYLFVQNYEAMRGSFSAAQATKIVNCIKMAAESGVPFVSVIDSAGARITDGAGVLEGYAKVIKAAASLKSVSPHIAVVKGACVGMMSVYANLADFVIFDKKAYMSLVSPSVVAAKADKNDGADKLFGAEANSANGVAALTYSSEKELKGQITSLLSYLSGEESDGGNLNRTAKGLSEDITADKVLAALCDDQNYLELYKDWAGVKTIFARVAGNSVGVISADCNLKGCDFKKIKKFVNILDNYGVPLITLLDSEGAAVKFECEVKGLTRLASDAFLAMSLSDNKKIAIVIGKAIGIAYSLLAAKETGFNYSVAFSGATFAPISAEQAVNFADIEYAAKENPIKKKQKLIDTYTEREGNPFLGAKDGYVDNIINADDVRPYICSVLSMLL